MTLTPCRYEAIFEAQGIAAGNAGLAVPLIMGVLLPLLFLYMKVRERGGERRVREGRRRM